MTPELAAELKTVLVGLAAAFVLAIVMVVHGFRRLAWIRSRTQDLRSEHERLLYHSQYRIAAQKEQAMAEQAEGEQQIEHFRRSLELWRRANQTRRPDDEETFEFIGGIVGLIEERLRELGVDPEE